MAESLYTTETPGGGNTDLADLGSGGTTSGSFMFGATGQVTGIRFYAPATLTGGHTYTAELYRATLGEGTTSGSGTGTLLASKAVNGATLTAGTWNIISFDTPVAVNTSDVYRAAIQNSAGRYVALANYFATGHTNGNVIGLQSGVTLVGGQAVRNGTYWDNSSPGTYPSKYFNQPSYLVDVVFDTGAPATNDGAFAITVAGPTATFTGDNQNDMTLAGAGSGPVAAFVGDNRNDGVLAGSGLGPLALFLLDTDEPFIPPTVDPDELEVNRYNTTVFIAANPTLLVLIPRTRTKSGTGVKWVAGVARAQQVARLIDQTGLPEPLEASDGFQRKGDYQLLLPYNGVVGLYDFWVHTDGIRWEVVGILPYNGYEVRAAVRRYGEVGV